MYKIDFFFLIIFETCDLILSPEFAVKKINLRKKRFKRVSKISLKKIYNY